MQVSFAIFAALGGVALAGPLPDSNVAPASSPLLAARGLFCSQDCCSGPEKTVCDCNIFGCNCEWTYGGGGVTKIGC
ncbi:uncharacterized protein J7T54_002163 [Emericellopsis cladophorae]|uniref:Uncharacterized protein n=1 Tax=Emericellopsis cladophorae TaxID=2686198 RepID=A0A9Q0BEJ9_9HYPO|nr:uncharacterized protein J7T54_002163 [Emericellopsis cladophorae]KAI6783002.1 hypothetical protein J7T54_002163 [Emericellopsis cladophorae]